MSSAVEGNEFRMTLPPFSSRYLRLRLFRAVVLLIEIDVQGGLVDAVLLLLGRFLDCLDKVESVQYAVREYETDQKLELG